MLTTTHTIMNVENNKIVTGYVITVQAHSCNHDYHVSIVVGIIVAFYIYCNLVSPLRTFGKKMPSLSIVKDMTHKC